jgi:hypothetical protein
MKFATDTEVKINQLLDGEPITRILPNLSGKENSEQILDMLKQKIKESS